MSLIKECNPHKEVIVRPDDKPWYESVIRSYSRKRDRIKSKHVKVVNPKIGVPTKNSKKKKKKKN